VKILVLCFSFFHLIPRLSAAENVEMPMILAGIAVKERKQRVADALASVNLQDRSSHRPDQLSGGQLQRVAIAGHDYATGDIVGR